MSKLSVYLCDSSVNLCVRNFKTLTQSYTEFRITTESRRIAGKLHTEIHRENSSLLKHLRLVAFYFSCARLSRLLATAGLFTLNSSLLTAQSWATLPSSPAQTWRSDD